MGQAISSIIADQNGDLKAQAQDQLNALLTMADLKYSNFIASVKDSSDNTLIPIDKLLLMNHSVSAAVTQNTTNITDAITAAAKGFASGQILEGEFSNHGEIGTSEKKNSHVCILPIPGITTVVGAGLNAVLGDIATNQSEHTTYAITCGDLGGIMRVDINIFCYSFTSKALTAVTNNVVMIAYTISSVDANKLDKDTLRDIVQVCYGGVVPKDQLVAIYNEVLAALDGA
ncbi:hypothetical protein B0H13DRAFT_1913356 [Mycena leptocephala]|nr:hypothetical protein B0H13DRAFT_1913356 [Mycena leptocephala]